MPYLLRHWLARAAACAFFAAPFCALAEDGVTADTILIGQSAVLSGPQSANVINNNKATQAYFDRVNAEGGIFGRKIKLVSLDDELKADKALANYKKLIEEDKVFALFAGVGTPTTAGAIGYLNQKEVPLIGPYAVADSVRAQSGKQVYYLRAGYYDESEKIIEHLITIGLTRVALVTLNNPGGKEVLANVEKQLGARNLKPHAVGMLEVNSSNLAAVSKALAQSRPQTIMVFAGGGASGDFIKSVIDDGFDGQMFCFSICSAAVITKNIGEKARGIGFSQIVQFPWDPASPVVREYQQLAKTANLAVDYAGMGGYLSGRFMVEALRRTGKTLTREKFRAALESGPFEMGGVTYTFKPGTRFASTYVELVMLTRDGRFVK
jgi:ABC-type branched-subunit amino acid transport system substrate-binding protein